MLTYARVLAYYLSSEALSFSAFRLGLALATLLAFALVWRRPSPGAGLSILDYATVHEGANAYRALAKELLK